MNLRPHRRPVPAIPIVSLIDIMLVLLIFFVATTTFKKKTAHMQITVPRSATLGTSTTATDDPGRVTIAISAKNEFFLDGAATTPDALAAKLKDLKQTRPGAKLELEADTVADFGLVVKAMGALTEAGYELSALPVRVQREAGPQ